MSYIGSFDYNDLNIDEKNHIDYFIKLRPDADFSPIGH